MNNNKEPWFVTDRARAFAFLLLTKNNKTRVQSYAGHDIAIELLADVIRNGKRTKRRFGVQLIGYLDLPPIENIAEKVLSHPKSDVPVCVFVIGVRELNGFFRWVVEPVVEDDRAILQHHVVPTDDAETNWQTLDDAGVDRLIDQVNAWYEAQKKHPRQHAKAKT